MNVKARKTKKQVNVENQAINLLSKEELNKKIEVVEKELRSYTWRELETNGKFAKNDKLSFITDDRKDPKLIANLVKDGNYGMPYLPEKVYADMRMVGGALHDRQRICG